MGFKEDCMKFYRRIIETNGQPSTKDAEECNIPFELWLNIATANVTPECLVRCAKKTLSILEGR
jgi:hypothetical protein